MPPGTSLVALSAVLLLASPSALPAAPPDLSGQWDVVFEVAGRPREYKLELKHKGETLEGALVSPRTGNRYPVQSASLRDATLRLEVPREIAGQEVVFKVTARVPGENVEKLEGKVEVEGLGEGKFTATRKGGPSATPRPRAQLAGKWKTVSVLPDGREREGQLEVRDKDGKLAGTVSGRRGTVALKTVEVAEGKVTLTLALPTDAGELNLVVKAAFDGPDRLKGDWSAADGSSSGAWSARREPPAAAKLALRDRYRVTATGADGKSHELDLVLKAEGERITGRLIRPDGKQVEILAGAIREGRVEIEADVADGGQVRRVKFSGAPAEGGVLKGTWSAGDSKGEWTGRPVEEL